MMPISKPQFCDEEYALCREVLDSGIIPQDPKVTPLENGFAQIAGSKFPSEVFGPTALHLALLAPGMGSFQGEARNYKRGHTDIFTQ